MLLVRTVFPGVKNALPDLTRFTFRESEDTILLMMKEVYGDKNPTDSTMDAKAGADEQTPSSWLDANVKKTFSYFNLTLPQSLTSGLGFGSASILPTANCNLSQPGSK